MVLLHRRAVARLLTCGAATAGVLAGAAPALAADADLDPGFGTAGEVVLPDPLDHDRNFPVDGFDLPDGRIVEVTSAFPFNLFIYGIPRAGERGAEEEQSFGRVIRLTADGKPDPSFSAGGAAGEGAPIAADGQIVFPLAAAPGPDGTTVVLSSYPTWRRGGTGTPVTLTRLLPDGSLDLSFDAEDDDPDGTRFVLLPGSGSGMAYDADRTPEGDFTVLSVPQYNVRGSSGEHFADVSRVSLDGDDVTTVELALPHSDDVQGAYRYPTKVAAAKVGDTVRTYVTVATEEWGYGAEQNYFERRFTELLAVDEKGLADGFGSGGVVTTPGVPVDVEGAPDGSPLAIIHDAADDGESDDNGDQAIVRWTTAGSSAVAKTLPTGEPGDELRRAFLHLTVDADDRPHLVGATYRQETADRDARGIPLVGEQVSAARLTPAGDADAGWGEGGLRDLPATADDVQRTVLQQGGIFHEKDGQLVVASGLFNDERVERGWLFDTAGTSVVRFSGKTKVPVVEDPPTGGGGGGGTPPVVQPPAPVKPAAQQRGCSSRRAFTIRLRPKNAKLRSATVKVNGKKVAVKRRNGRLTARINLTGRKAGTFKVSVVAKDRRGRTYRETRTYRTCSAG